MTTERIQIEVTERGTRRVKMGLKGIGDEAERADSVLKFLKRTLATLGLAAIAREALQTADAYTNLQNQLKLVTTGTDNLNLITKELLASSNRTRSNLEATAATYVKVARSAGQLGLSQQDVLNFTESLNQAIILSGSDAQQASAGILQLGQAIGSGVLRGDELNSVLENTSEVAQVIAKGMGVTIGQLRALGSEGKITAADIIRAFREAEGELRERFGQTVPTVGQAMTVLKNQVTVFLGELNNGAGVTRILSQAILGLAENLDVLYRALTAVALTIGVTLAAQAIPKAIAGIRTLVASLATIGGIAVAIVAATSALVAFSDQITLSTDGLVTLADVGLAVWNQIKDGLIFVWNTAKQAFGGVNESSMDAFENMSHDQQDWLEESARAIDDYLTAWLAVAKAIGNVFGELWDRLVRDVQNLWRLITDPSIENFKRLGDRVGETLGEAINRAFLEAAQDPVTFAQGIVSDARDISDARIRREIDEARKADLARSQLGVRPNASASTAEDDDKVSFRELLDNLRREGELLTVNAEQREALHNIFAIERRLKRDLTQGEVDQVHAVTETNQALQLRAEVLDHIGQPANDFIEVSRAMNQLMMESPELVRQLNEELANLELQFLKLQEGGGFAEAYGREMRIMQLETRNAVADIGASFARIFGPGGSLSRGLGDAIAQSIVFGERLDQSIKKVAQSVLANLISSLVQLGVNMSLNAILGNNLAAASAATSVASAAAVSAAWAPAAALVNAATFGAGASAGTAATASSIATIKGLSAVAGFAEGGFTGMGARDAVSGLVHGQEFVLNADTTARVGRRNLERLNDSGGRAGMGGGNVQMFVSIDNQLGPSAEFEVQPLSPTEVRIIAKQAVREEAGKTIAAELGNPSSRTSRALGSHTTAQRKRV